MGLSYQEVTERLAFCGDMAGSRFTKLCRFTATFHFTATVDVNRIWLYRIFGTPGVRKVHMGLPSALNRHQQREAIARREAGEALTDIARTFGVSHTTIGRLSQRGS
jgi:Helix-turn-helix domain of resolvase